MRGISLLVKDLIAYYEGLCSMESINDSFAFKGSVDILCPLQNPVSELCAGK
jgi:hypothetical protein